MDQKWEWTWTSFFPWFPHHTSASRPTNVIMCSTPSHHIAHSCNTVCVWRVAVPLLFQWRIFRNASTKYMSGPRFGPPVPWCRGNEIEDSVFQGEQRSLSSEIQLHKTNHVPPPPPKHKGLLTPLALVCVVVWSRSFCSYLIARPFIDDDVVTFSRG